MIDYLREHYLSIIMYTCLALTIIIPVLHAIPGYQYEDVLERIKAFLSGLKKK